MTRPVCHTTWVQEVVTKPLMVRWCMEEDLEEEKVEVEEEEVVDDDDEYEVEEEENNSIEDNGPLLDARLLWDNL